MALRFDKTKLDDPRLDHNGYLIAKAHATRTGVFVYHHPDGSTTRELRHPDDVFRPDSVLSLKNRPITSGHPAEGKLTSENTRRLSVGMAIDDPSREDIYLDTSIQINDKNVIDNVLDEENPLRELSCGYESEVIKEDGTYQGEEYDHRQTNIKYNHIALVKRGRAGAQVRLQLDEADAAGDGLEDFIEVDSKLTTDFLETDKTIEIDVKGFNMFVPKSFRTVSIKGVEGVQVSVGRLNRPHSGKAGSDTPQKYIFDKDKFSVSEARIFVAKRRDSLDLVNIRDIDQTSNSNSKTEPTEINDMLKIKRQAINIRGFKMDGYELEIDDSIETGQKAVETVLGKLDSALEQITKVEGEKDKLQGKIDALKDEGKITLATLNDQVKDRTDAVNAAHYLGMKDYMDMETDDLKKAIVCKAYPQVKIDDLTKDHIEGRYDTIIEGMNVEGENLKRTLRLKTPSGDQGNRFPVHSDELAPRDRFLNDTKDMYMSEAEKKLQA